MSRNQRWLVLGTGAFLAAAVLILGGCAAEGPVKLAGLGQKIEAARTRADHQEITAVYEQQAAGDIVFVQNTLSRPQLQFLYRASDIVPLLSS